MHVSPRKIPAPDGARRQGLGELVAAYVFLFSAPPPPERGTRRRRRGGRARARCKSRSVISRLASRRQLKVPRARAGGRRLAHSSPARSRTVTKASVPSSEASNASTPASAPKVVSGCCGPKIASRLASLEVVSGARALILPSASASSAVRSSWSHPSGGSRRAPLCQLPSGFSVLSFKFSEALSASSARRSSAARMRVPHECPG